MQTIEANLSKLAGLEGPILEYSSILLQDVAAIKQSVRMLEAGMNNTVLEDNLLYLDRVPELAEYLSDLESVSLNEPNGSRKIALLSGRRPPSASSSRTLVVATDGSVMKKLSWSGAARWPLSQSDPS